MYSMSGHVSSAAQATEFAEKMAATAHDIGLDGMDLDVEDSGTGADVQVGLYVLFWLIIGIGFKIALIKETRRLLGPDFQITYTIPALTGQIEPWRSTIVGTLEELDAVNVMAYDYYWTVGI